MLRKLNEFLSLFSYETAELTALEIAEWLGRPKSTVYRVLARVADEGFLDRDEATGCYRVGIFFAVLADLAPRSTSLQRLVFPVLPRLSRETQESVTLLVRHGGEGLAIAVVESVQPLMVPMLRGGHLPLHVTSGGKVLLAWLPDDERRSVLRAPLERYTEHTVTNIAQLMGELDRALAGVRDGARRRRRWRAGTASGRPVARRRAQRRRVDRTSAARSCRGGPGVVSWPRKNMRLPLTK